MNIYTIISKEATEKYADTYLAYNYEKTVERIKEKARTGYKVLCEYFNGSTTRTGLCVVSEDRAIEVLGLNNYDVRIKINRTSERNGSNLIMFHMKQIKTEKKGEKIWLKFMR